MSKAKIIKKTLKDQNLVNMFNQMLGGDGDPEIIKQKTSDLKSLARIIAGILKSFATGPMKQFAEYQVWSDEFLKFGSATESLVDLDYKEIKEHNQTKLLILVCSELVIYAHFLQPATLSDKWVLSHPGLVYEPFAFSSLDIKHIWNNASSTSNVKRYCLQTFSLLFNKCHEIYKITTAPDVDVKKFSQVIVDSIDKVKGQPELSRCKDAFEKIKESVTLLETNFGDYYKDMVQSENPNTIIENFIIDVSQGQNMNLSLMRQFRTIINFYKKQSSGKIKDPKVKKLFESLNSRMDILESKVTKTGGDENSAVPDESSSSESDEDEINAP